MDLGIPAGHKPRTLSQISLNPTAEEIRNASGLHLFQMVVACAFTRTPRPKERKKLLHLLQINIFYYYYYFFFDINSSYFFVLTDGLIILHGKKNSWGASFD